MDNQEIEDIKVRIDRLTKSDRIAKLGSASKNEYSFEDSIHLTKEQYLEIELGLEQIKRGEVYDAREVLKSLRNW